VRIRPATPADLPAIIEIERENVITANWSHEHYKSLLRPAVSDLSENFFIVIEVLSDTPGQGIEQTQAPIAGYLAAQGVAGEWSLQYILVAKKFRRHGLATKLMNELIEHARNKNGTDIFLEVRESNQSAQALYKKLGFQVLGTSKNYYPAPHQEDAIRLALALN
jgi:[ribosomal protein S18]-alanine N-acetyltransferase